MNSTIVPMTENDRADVLEMMRVFYASEAVISNGSEQIFNNDIDACVGADPCVQGYIFRSGGVIQGYAMIVKSFSTEFGKACIWIEDLYIKEPFRGMGTGSAFLRFVQKENPEAVLRLEVEHTNKNAIAVYERQGYTRLPYREMIRL